VKASKLALVWLVLFAGAASAQVQKGERIEITGSNIKRVQEEGALPVQVISRQDIERRGITSAEELVMLLSANGSGADNLSSNVGIQLGTTDRNNNGNSSANLRGLGASSTLVLLNGRRLSTHGAKGNAVDLNSIPLAAIDRVEVLKDGASAIYGTDAIGGVINFILRKDYRGVEITGSADVTEEGGGNLYRGSVLAGWGDLSRDRWNVMGMLTYDKQERLSGSQRSFSNGFQPDRGLSPDTAGAPFASQTGLAGTAIGATFMTPGLGTGTQTFNRANLLSFLGQCDTIENMSQYQFALWGAGGARYACAYDYGGAEVLIQAVERTQGVGRATFQINNDHTAFVELIGTKTKAEKAFEEYQITTTGTFAGMQYPVNGPYYQDLSAYIPTFNRNLPIAYRWRCMECGLRTIETETDAYRFLAGLEGTFGGRWDYKLAAGESGSKAESVLASGFMYTAPLTAALASGLVNPWLMPGQTQTPEGQALLDGARANGAKLFAGESNLSTVDGAVSGELFNLPAGPVAAAVGFDYRRESYRFDDGSRTTQPVYQAPFDPQFEKVSRTVKALYGEVAVPIVRNLEATFAVRHDDYSDFGTTTNPKVTVKWNPTNAIMFRGSYNEGFRAPSFFQLYTQITEAPVPGNIADPVLCPAGNVPGADLSVCAIRPDSQQGGNPGLQPETSKQWSIGLVFQPTPWMSGSVDLWQIKRQDLVYELTPQQVIANYTTFPNSLVRGANGRLDDPGGYIRAGFVNADGDITKGIDVNLRFNGRVAGGRWIANLDGTYIDSHRSRIFETDDYVESVGQWDSRDLFVRWKHTASVAYETGPWAFTLYQQYTKGYKDEVPAGTVPPGFNPNVDDYWLHHVMVAYTGFKNMTLTFGVKNIFDEDPPFTAHNLDFAAGAGWDPRVADPRGRSYVARINYKF
jgi:iron complex outermembrane receptor protein